MPAGGRLRGSEREVSKEDRALHRRSDRAPASSDRAGRPHAKDPPPTPVPASSSRPTPRPPPSSGRPSPRCGRTATSRSSRLEDVRKLDGGGAAGAPGHPARDGARAGPHPHGRDRRLRATGPSGSRTRGPASPRGRAHRGLSVRSGPRLQPGRPVCPSRTRAGSRCPAFVFAKDNPHLGRVSRGAPPLSSPPSSASRFARPAGSRAWGPSTTRRTPPGPGATVP